VVTIVQRSRWICGGVENGQTWADIKTHMGYNQVAYDAEYAALARALESTLIRQMTPERVTIFTDA